MPKGPSRPWRKLAPHTEECIPFFRAALQAGFGKNTEIKGIKSAERAHDLRRGIYNAASLHKVSAEAGRAEQFATGDEMGVHQNTDGTFTLKFRLHDKHKARARHVEKYGTDRTLWPYNPREKKSWGETNGNM